MSDAIKSALRETILEAHWQRAVITDDDATDEANLMAAASIVATFLKHIPVGLDVGTLLAEVQEIANG